MLAEGIEAVPQTRMVPGQLVRVDHSDLFAVLRRRRFMGLTRMDYVGEAIRLLEEVRSRTPRVHCITNHAAQAFTADVLLAAGALPSLTMAADEIESFLSSSSAVLVNLGTLDETRLKAIEVTMPFVRDRGFPWVLDPVFVDRSDPRLRLARTLFAHGPTVVRGNWAECGALAEQDDLQLASLESKGPVVAMTGPVDMVLAGGREVKLHNGHEFMGLATAVGCALSALVGAFLSVEQDPHLAAVAALLIWGVSGEVAGQKASGPGTFRPLLLDALHGMDAQTLKRVARLEVSE